MKQENGKNIYSDFIKQVEIAKFRAEQINNIVNNSLFTCIDMIKKSNGIKDILNNELILLQNFDINIYNNSEKKIDNRINLCHTALEEYDLFNNNKESYLEKTYKRNMFSPKEIDLTKDTLFEQSVKTEIYAKNLLKSVKISCHNILSRSIQLIRRLKRKIFRTLIFLIKL